MYSSVGFYLLGLSTSYNHILYEIQKKMRYTELDDHPFLNNQNNPLTFEKSNQVFEKL